MSLLSNRQKAVLCQLAKKAYDRQQAANAGYTLEEWRHHLTIKACGKSSLTQCTQRDYRPLYRHFNRLAGNTKVAFKTAMREDFEGRDQAMHRLLEEISKAKDVIPDPVAWCRGMLMRKRKHDSLEDASEEDLWHIVKTLSSRAAALRKKLQT